jgi:drug/metabolite transporter (DMT)-like permease
MKHGRTNLPLGAVQMVAAAFFFALMAAFVQMASDRLPGPVVVFGRNAFGLLFILPLALRHGTDGLRTGRLLEHILRTVSGLGSMYCFFFAIHNLRLADAVLLQYTLPLFLPLIEAVWIRQPIAGRIWGPLLLGFLGVILVLKPGAEMFREVALVGLCAGLLGAVAQTGIRRMTTTEPTTRIILYFALFSTVISAGPAAASWVTPDRNALWLLMAAGAAATAAQVAMTRAYSQAPAAQVGAFIYASVPFAMLFDWLRRGHPPGWTSTAGALLIAGAGVMMLRVGRAPPEPDPVS